MEALFVRPPPARCAAAATPPLPPGAGACAGGARLDLELALGAAPGPPRGGSASSGSSAASAASAASSGSAAASPRRSSPASRQKALAAALRALEGPGGPAYFSFPTFLCYLAGGPAPAADGNFDDTLGAAARALLAAGGGGPVFLADGLAFAGEAALGAEFPELGVFGLAPGEAFVEAPAHPGLWLETQRFADLRGLSRMRRELRRTGLPAGKEGAALVASLLGL